jgi:chemotaxis receptor (MCP) glutamine deamidase CheD
MAARKRKTSELKDEAGKYAHEAIEALVELMRNSGSDPVRVAAAKELLDRAHGKPKTESTVPVGESLQEMVRAAFERDDP